MQTVWSDEICPPYQLASCDLLTNLIPKSLAGDYRDLIVNCRNASFLKLAYEVIEIPLVVVNPGVCDPERTTHAASPNPHNARLSRGVRATAILVAYRASHRRY